MTRYNYDEAGNETQQIDALNRTNSFGYDSLGRRITHSMPGGQMESFGYNAAGNMTRWTNFAGAVITNEFDAMNRMTNTTSINGYHVARAFSATGQRTNMVDAGGATSYLLDIRDRLVQKTVAFAGGPTLSLNYGYDPDGNVTNIWSSTPGGVTNFYGYDALNRLTNVLANGSLAAAYGFDAVGNLETVRYGNGITNRLQYDTLNRLTNAVWNLGSAPLASFYYQLGPAGNRTSLSENVGGTSRAYAWTYDAVYRLKQEAISGGTSGTLSYGFDLVGNRTNRTVTGSLSLTNQSFAYGTNDWLTSDVYDNNGNTTASSGNNYQYDPLNHLTNANSGAALLCYDGDGNRVKKTVGGTTTFYLLDDCNPSDYAQVLEEWTASGGTASLAHVYNYGLQLISQREPGASTNYFVFDGHGSTRLLADIAGNVVNAFTYDAYGSVIASNATPQTVYLYCGQQWDTYLEMYLDRARYYQSGAGRFWTSDSAEGDQQRPVSLHRYFYCEDDPIDGVDPSGMDDLIELEFGETEEVGMDAETVSVDEPVKTSAVASIVQSFVIVGFLAETSGLFDPNPEAMVNTLKQRDPTSMFFLHATSTGAWPELASGGLPVIVPEAGDGDFGVGFYTFNASSADPNVLAASTEWARRVASRYGGEPVVTIWSMKRSKYSTLTKYHFDTLSDDAYSSQVGEFRAGVRTRTGSQVAIGQMAKFNGRAWIRNSSLPMQYKFEGSSAVKRLVFRGGFSPRPLH